MILRVLRDDEEDQVRFEVQDDGHGIPDSLRQQVFEPYFTTREERGTGLGLAVVRAIAHEHGGSAEIDSTLGMGTTVRIRLPLAKNGAGLDVPRSRKLAC